MTTGNLATLFATIAMPVPIWPDPITPNDLTDENPKVVIALSMLMDYKYKKYDHKYGSTIFYQDRSFNFI